MTITSVQDSVVKTAAFDGTGVDISGISGDWTLVLLIRNLKAACNARFVFSDSVDAFSASLAGPSVSVSGAVSSSADRRYTFTKKDFPNLRFGTTSAVLRLSLAELTGTSPTVTYQGWIES
jgi:hypothetical protein